MKILLTIGTRPEAIKLAPLVHEMRRRDDFVVEVCATAQHREMLDQALRLFEIVPTYDLDLMSPNQSLADLTGRILSSFDATLQIAQPDVVIVQGDTTTTLACSLAAFYRRTKVAHVEAGLRTDNRFSPFPEEINRRLTSVIADWHFTPTERGRQALLAENYQGGIIHVVGNTVIDALLMKADQVRQEASALAARFPFLTHDVRMVLITCHRRENFGWSLQNICRAVARLSGDYPNVQFVYPVHLNPNIREPVHQNLAHLTNVHLLEPQDYLAFVWLMGRADLILTDSGGIQEEAPTLATPVLVMRDTTERPEAVEAGAALLVGSGAENIVAATRRLLNDEDARRRMANVANPFGDGRSSARIADILARGRHDAIGKPRDVSSLDGYAARA